MPAGVFKKKEALGNEVITPETDEKLSDPIYNTSRAKRISVVVNQKNKIVLQDNYLACLFYVATKPDKGFRVENLRPNYSSGFGTMLNADESEKVAKKTLNGEVIFYDVSKNNLYDGIICENQLFNLIAEAAKEDPKETAINAMSIDENAQKISPSQLDNMTIIAGSNSEDEKDEEPEDEKDKDDKKDDKKLDSDSETTPENLNKLGEIIEKVAPKVIIVMLDNDENLEQVIDNKVDNITDKIPPMAAAQMMMPSAIQPALPPAGPIDIPPAMTAPEILLGDSKKDEKGKD
jgi:hypothetical protein